MNKEQQIENITKVITVNSKNIDLYKLLRNSFPNLVSDIDSFQTFLFRNDISEIDKLETLKNLLLTKKEAEKRRKHEKGYKENPYKTYCELFPNSHLNQIEFSELYNAITSIKISNSIFKFTDKSQNLIQIFNQLGIDCLKALDTFCSEKIISPEEFCNILNIDINYNKTLIKKLFKNTNGDKAITLFDTLSSYLIDQEYNDVCIENKIIYYKVFDDINNAKRNVIIYNPNLLFIKKYADDRMIQNREKIYFVVENRTIQKIVNYRYKQIKVDAFETFKQRINEDGFEIEKALLFLNSKNILKQEEIIKMFADKTINSNILVFGFDSIYKYMSNYKIKKITLFPSGINNCTIPEKKSLFFINSNSNTTTLSRYSFYKNSDIQRIVMKANQYEINLKNLTTTVRKYFNSKDNESDTKRKKANIINITKELNICWTSIPEENNIHKDIRIYVKEAFLQNGKIKYGSKLMKSVRKISRADYSYLYNYVINDYFNKKSKNKYIIDYYIPHLKDIYIGHEITLRFVVLLYSEFLDTLNQTQSAVYRKTKNCDIYDMVPSKITLEYINEVSKELFDNEESIIIFKSILHKIFVISINNGYSSHNPLQYEIKRIKKEEEKINEVIRNLSTSRISDESTKKYIDICIKKIKHGFFEYVGALLRMATPLSTQLIRALKWSDFQKIVVGNTEFYRLLIRRQINNDNTSYIPLSKITQIIKLPLPTFAGKILDECWNKIINDYPGILESELRKIPTVIGKDNFIDGYGIISYYHLDKIVNDIIVRNNLIPLKKIFILDKNKNLVMKNLSTKNADVFRIFYKNRCSDYKLDVNEISYLCGNKPYDTYANNYCDYDNDISQLILFRKIERMFYKVVIEDERRTYEDILEGKTSYYSNTTNKAEINIIAKNIKSIDIKAKYGFSIIVNNRERRKK